MKSLIKLKHYIQMTAHKEDLVLRDKLEEVWIDCVKLSSLIEVLNTTVSEPVKELIKEQTKNVFYD